MVSFQTGVNPGKHGVFDFIDYRKKIGTPIVNNAKDIKTPRIWDILGNSGLKSLVINMPLTYPVSKINGVVVSSFLTPNGADYVYPRKYQKVLDDLDYRIDILTDNKYGDLPNRKLKKDEEKRYLDELIDISEKRLLAFQKLSSTNDFSFNFLLFKETDLVQHLFWRKKELGIYYQKLDKLLEELYCFIKSKNKNFEFILISDHGFHEAPMWEVSIYSWFNKEFNLSRSKNSKTWMALSTVNKKLKNLGLTPSSMSRIKKIRSEILKDSKKDFVDDQRFLITTHGILDFGWFKDNIDLKKLVTKLRKLKHRNNKVFKFVKLSKDIYHGQYSNLAPDIVWETNKEFIVDTNVYTKEVFKKRVNTLLGEHGSDSKGIYVVSGENIIEGKSDNQNMWDMTLLIHRSLGVVLPWYSDGRIPSFYNENIDKREKKTVEDKIKREISSLGK